MEGFEDFSGFDLTSAAGFDALDETSTNFGYESLNEDPFPMKRSSEDKDDGFPTFGTTRSQEELVHLSGQSDLPPMSEPEPEPEPVVPEPDMDDGIRGKRPAGRGAKTRAAKGPAEKSTTKDVLGDGMDINGEEKKEAKKGSGKKSNKTRGRSRKNYNDDDDDDDDFVVSQEESDEALLDGEEDQSFDADDDDEPKKAGKKPKMSNKRKRSFREEPPRANKAPFNKANNGHYQAPQPPRPPMPVLKNINQRPMMFPRPGPTTAPAEGIPPFRQPMRPPVPRPPGMPNMEQAGGSRPHDPQFHQQVQQAAARVLSNVERRLNQNDVLLQLMQEKNEAYTMLDLILRFRFNADHALAELEQLPLRFGGRGFLPPLVNPRNFTPRDTRYVPRLIMAPTEGWLSEEQKRQQRIQRPPPVPNPAMSNFSSTLMSNKGHPPQTS